MCGRPPLPPVPSSLDWEAFRSDGHALIDYIADYHGLLGAGKHPISDPTLRPGFLSSKKAGFLSLPPAASFADVLNDFEQNMQQGVIKFQHRNFFGYSTHMMSPAAVLGDLLGASLSQPGSTWATSPAAAELEFVVMNELAHAMDLPDFAWATPTRSCRGGGTIQPTATEACIVAMLAAKRRAMAMRTSVFNNSQDEQANLSKRLVVYCSDQSHLCVERAARVVGIGTVRRIPCVFNVSVQNFPLDADTLKERIAEDIALGLIPCFLNANFGATGTGAIDPLPALAELCEQCHIWLHVDAAYAGAVALVPELRPLLAGAEASDSFVVNGSKWMNMSFGCSFLFLKRVSDVQDALGKFPPTDGHDVACQHQGGVDLKDLQLGFSRPFRSLKVYAALRTVGLDGIRASIRRHVMLAKYLDDKLRAHGAFESEMIPQFGLVVFRVKMCDDDENRRLCLRLQSHGYFVTPMMSRQLVCVRVSLSHAALSYDDMDKLFQAVVDCSAAGTPSFP
jgi:aromatic-L-amino-acid decarboxylase